MKVSVVIPSYNQAKFLPATLDSVLSQDYPDTEILVFDGGSTDETLSILKGYGGKIQWVSQKDGGQPDAINQGLQRATGDILAYLNSDDIYLPNALKNVTSNFDANPKCPILYGDAWHLHEDGSIMERYYTECWSYPRLLEICYLCQPAVFWRREVIERFGIFDDTLQYALDYDYWLRVGRELEFSYLEGTYLAGSRLHQGTKTLKHRVKTHHQILQVAMRHSTKPPYRWLMNLASAIVEAERSQHQNGDLDEATRRALLVQAAIKNADRYRIPLDFEFLTSLEAILAVP
jgi:glycosyltransferase involved in cell wall biosynthesis